MARTNLDATSVYHNAAQGEALKKAAALENRSVSNFLLNLGIQKAAEMGIPVFNVSAVEEPETRPRKLAVGGGGKNRRSRR